MVAWDCDRVGRCCADPGGGGPALPTPTPDPFNDQGETWYTGPVPDHLQQITGETSWQGILDWMDRQAQAAGFQNADELAGQVIELTGDTATGEVELRLLPKSPTPRPATDTPDAQP